jgi:hypothetical protein
MQEKPLVCLVVSETAFDQTEGKLLFVHQQLKEHYDVVVMAWGQAAIQAARAKNMEVVCPRVAVAERQPDRVRMAQQAMALLDRPLQGKDSPTWGRLIALDDYIGAAQLYDITGVGRLQPACVVKAVSCGESSTPTDEHMELAIARWTHQNKIPVVGLEVQSPAGPLRATRWEPSVWLRKTTVGLHQSGPPQTLLHPAHRYYCAVWRDAMLEDYLEHEASLRAELHVQDEQTLIYLPFHLYYIQECGEALAWLGKQKKVLTEAQARVVVGCGDAFRRGLRERDIVGEGLKRFWEPLEGIDILEGVSVLRMVLLANTTILPYPLSVIEDAARRWDVCLTRPGQTLHIPRYDTPLRAVQRVLAAQRAQEGLA